MKHLSSAVLLLFVACTSVKVGAQQPNLEGVWVGTLDQNLGAAGNPRYSNYYRSGDFVNGKPTHTVKIELISTGNNRYMGRELKALAVDSAYYGLFSIVGEWSRKGFTYKATKKLQEKARMGEWYCFTLTTLRHTQDAEYEYLAGRWESHGDNPPCASAWLHLKKKLVRIIPPPLTGIPPGVRQSDNSTFHQLPEDDSASENDDSAAGHPVTGSLEATSVTEQDIVGTWTGIHYIGTPPSERKSYGGVSSPSFYDSARVTLHITGVENGVLDGNTEQYIIGAEKGNFVKTIIQGTIDKYKVFATDVSVTEKSLTKYPGLHWCQGSFNGVVIRQDERLILEMFPIPGGCEHIGPATLYKEMPVVKRTPIRPSAGAEEKSLATKPVAEKKPRNDAKSATTKDTKPAAAQLKNVLPGGHDLESKFKTRKTGMLKFVYVTNDTLTLKFFDNGTVDDDTVSIFLNGKPIIAKRRLTDKAILAKVILDKSAAFNEIGMLAENLGSIPPNTTLLTIHDGATGQEIHLSSDSTANAVVKIGRTKRR